MAGYVEGVDRGQPTLFPDRLDDFVDPENPVRLIGRRQRADKAEIA